MLNVLRDVMFLNFTNFFHDKCESYAGDDMNVGSNQVAELNVA